MYGWKSGAWLGLVFGLVVLLSGDAAAFLTVNPIGTVVTVLLKGLLAGLCAGLVYKLLERFNTYAATITAALVCPVVNTGIFLLGCYLFFLPTISEWAQAAGFGSGVGTYMIVGLVGFNFIFEVLVNMVLSPAIVLIINVGKRLLKQA